MELEPLKDKIVCFDGRPHIGGKHFEDCDMYFSVQKVKSAVEWFKKEINKSGYGEPRKIYLQKLYDMIAQAFEDVNKWGNYYGNKLLCKIQNMW